MLSEIKKRGDKDIAIAKDLQRTDHITDELLNDLDEILSEQKFDTNEHEQLSKLNDRLADYFEETSELVGTNQNLVDTKNRINQLITNHEEHRPGLLSEINLKAFHQSLRLNISRTEYVVIRALGMKIKLIDKYYIF